MRTLCLLLLHDHQVSFGHLSGVENCVCFDVKLIQFPAVCHHSSVASGLKAQKQQGSSFADQQTDFHRTACSIAIEKERPQHLSASSIKIVVLHKCSSSRGSSCTHLLVGFWDLFRSDPLACEQFIVPFDFVSPIHCAPWY